MTTTLICGYGKIGAIKASIWRSLGCTVFVYDQSPERVMQASSQGFITAATLADLQAAGLGTGCVVDISVPSGLHVAALQQVLKKVPDPGAVLIEKPVVSSYEELEALRQLVARSGIQNKTFVNETYYASDALRQLRLHIQQKGFNQVRQLDITFLKNRLPDVQAGRFVDHLLGAYGIELPHMLACADYLGFGMTDAPFANDYLLNVFGERGSEGLRCSFMSSSAVVHLLQALGPFTIGSDGTPVYQPDIQPLREVFVRFADESTARLRFDPVPGMPRYYSQLALYDSGGRRLQRQLIPDNHMQSLLRAVAATVYAPRVASSESLRLAQVGEAMAAAEMLFSLRRTAQMIDDASTPAALPA